MPSLTKQTEDFRILQALEATKLMAKGVKKVSACDQVGLSIRQYDYWLARDDGAIEGLQKAIIEAERIRLADLTNATAILLRKLIDQATQPGLDINTQLNTLKYLDKLRVELEEKLGINSSTDDAEVYQLKGPITRVEESKMEIFRAAN